MVLSTALVRHPLTAAFFRQFTTPVMEEASATLPPDESAAAQARGRTLDLGEFIAEILTMGAWRTCVEIPIARLPG